MPKILQITIDGNIGSTGRIAEAIGIFAMERGWVSYIAHGRFARPSNSKIIKIGTATDVWTHGMQTRLFDMHGLGTKSSTIKFINQVKDIKPDVIHLHNIHGYYINMEVLFNYLSKTTIPLIWTFHDCWAFTGHCSHFDFVGCEKWKTECHHCPQKRDYPASYFFDRSRKNFQLKKELFTSVPDMTIVSVSKWLDNVVSESFLSHISREVIYNGVDIDIFNPVTDRDKVKEKLAIGNGLMILGVAGVWPKQKGLKDFIKLSEVISKEDSIVLVGLNELQINSLPPNIIGIARTENQQELKDLYATADVFLNLSVEETFGLTTAEALSCGTPAIVYNSTACPELVDAETGFVVKRNDIDALLAAVNTVRQNGKAFYSAACRNRAIKLFNQNERFNDYIDLYERRLEAGKLRR